MEKEQQLIKDVELFSKENICILVERVQQIGDRLVQVEMFNKQMIRSRQNNFQLGTKIWQMIPKKFEFPCSMLIFGFSNY